MAMPSFDLRRNRLDFFPDQVPSIREAVWSEIGAEVTVRRHLCGDQTSQICLLELQDPLPVYPEGFRWIDSHVNEHAWADALSMEAWRQWKLVDDSEQRLAPWEELGWYRSASTWVLERLEQVGYRPLGPVEQIKGAWGWSSLLRVDTDHGKVYFKAGYPRPPFEAKLLPHLAEVWPAKMPRVLAADSQRNWTLLAEFSGVNLEPLDMRLHAQAIRTFAEIQRDSCNHLWRWHDAGVRDMSPRTLLWEMEINPAAYRQIETILPRIRELFLELADSPLPLCSRQRGFPGGQYSCGRRRLPLFRLGVRRDRSSVFRAQLLSESHGP